MATIQNINVSTPNDGLGDTLRVSQIKANENFAELNSKKVEKIAGKDLSTNDFTNALQTKLNGIAPGAEVNVQADWNQEDDQADDFIKNKPVGQFLQAFGTLHYSNNLATQNATANVELKLLNNILGPYTNLTNAPFGTGTVWNPTTNQFDFSSLEVGDYVELRPDLDINLDGSNTSFSLYMKMAIGGVNPWQLNIHNAERKSTDVFNEAPYIGFDISNEDSRDFPSEIYIKTDANATVKVNGWLVAITRKSVNIIDIEGGDEYVINKQNNLTPDGTGTKYPTVDAINNYVVKLTENQTIDGVKTFVQPVILAPQNTGSQGSVSVDASEFIFTNGDGLIPFAIKRGVMSLRTISNALIRFLFSGSARDFTLPATGGTLATESYVDTGLALKQDTLDFTPEDVAHKNQNNGYCGLDSGGKVPIANLPTTLLKYQGVWNASTNTPTLTNPDTTKIGNVYNVGVAGTQFGIDFKLGDWLIYNASGVAEKSDNSDDVVSVNGQTGVVNLTTSNVSEGSNLYFTTDRVLSTLLNGLSLATGGAIVSTDSVLTAFGKLQKQITDAISELFWTKTGDDIRNNNTGNVEMKMNDSKQVSFLNFNNTLVSRITEDGSYQIFGNGGIFGNGAGCIITFANRVFNFASYADGLGRYIFNPIYLNNTTGIVDVIGFQNKTINPTSGNAVFNFLDIDPIINQSGGANGITRAIYINPTLTSAADFRALEITGGKVIIPNGLASNEAVNLGQISDRIAYKLKATYALMIADGTPIVPTIYSVTNDENKSYSRSTYLWKPDGKREWIATTPDN